MIKFIIENAGSFIVGAIVLLIVAAIVISMIRKKRSGSASCSCGCDCGGCSVSSGCHQEGNN